ncbi:MarR family transcriptional regulator [Synergistaceae bacterium OttesenSCG-928-D05]|nr:MarR family transcriptional regulator [Synergistaceae bacterium OttesenSCG-928-D05]
MSKISPEQKKKLLKMSDLWRRYDQVYEDWSQRQGLSTNALTLLEEMLIRPEGVEPAEIADYLGIPRQTMTSTLDSLESKGFLARFPHEKDRRRKVVRFTPEGKKFAEKTVEGLHRWELDSLSSIGSRELDRTYLTLEILCRKMADSLKTEK